VAKRNDLSHEQINLDYFTFGLNINFYRVDIIFLLCVEIKKIFALFILKRYIFVIYCICFFSHILILTNTFFTDKLFKTSVWILGFQCSVSIFKPIVIKSIIVELDTLTCMLLHNNHNNYTY
jgi:hypothetical protein